jgi:2,4-dienoyl-CoA reductase (NADPH2)
VRNLTNAMYQLNVDVRLNSRATADELLAGGYDDIIVATGARDRHGEPSIPGSDAPWTYNVVDILERRRGSETLGTGCRVLIVDGIGFHDTTGVAEALAERGAAVELVTSSLYVGGDLGTTLDYEHWSRRMGEMGATLTPDTVVLGVGNHSVDGMDVYTGEPRHWDGIDALVIAYPSVADDELYFALKGRHPSLQRAGDCVTPRRAHAAIIEGNFAARAIGSADRRRPA